MRNFSKALKEIPGGKIKTLDIQVTYCPIFGYPCPQDYHHHSR
jgi:hypothetical protein